MTFSPIVERELRIASRRPGTYWLRAALAAFGFIACAQWFDGNLIAANPAAVGQGSFRMLSWLGLAMALGACVFTADSICLERREGTLGLLFLTALKSHDVVLGKLAVLGFVALFALLGFAPALMLSLVAGGVTGGDVVRMSLVLLNIMFLSLAAGLFVSVRAWSQSGAIFGSLSLLAAILVGPFGLEMLVRLWKPFQLAMLSPFSGFIAANDAVYATDKTTFWAALMATHLGAWLLLAAATVTLQRNRHRVRLARGLKPARPQSRRLLGAPRVILFDRENRRRAFAPVARAVLRLRGQKSMAWLAALFAFTGSICSVAAMVTLGSMVAAATTSVVFFVASTALFALMAGRFLLEARRSGELELLLVTPVGARGILREQRLAVLRLLMGPLYLVTLGAIIEAAASFHLAGDGLGVVITNLCVVADSVLGILAVCRVAMWFGTRVNNSLALMGCAVGLVVVAPLVVLWLVPFLLLGASGAFESWLVLAALLTVAKDLFFIWWADRKLRQEFRSADCAMLGRLFGWSGSGASGKIA